MNRPKREKKSITDVSTLKSLEQIKRARDGEKRTDQLQEEDDERKRLEQLKEQETEFDKEERKRKNRDFIEGDSGYRETSDNEDEDEDEDDDGDNSDDDYSLDEDDEDGGGDGENNDSDQEEAIEVGRKKKRQVKKKSKKDENGEPKVKTPRVKKTKEKKNEIVPEKNRIIQFINNPTESKSTSNNESFFFDKLKKSNSNTLNSTNSTLNSNELSSGGTMSSLDIESMLNDLQSAPDSELDLEKLKEKQLELEKKLEKEALLNKPTISTETIITEGVELDDNYEFDFDFNNPITTNNNNNNNTKTTTTTTTTTITNKNLNKVNSMSLPTRPQAQQFISPKQTNQEDWWSKTGVDSVVLVKKLEEIMPKNSDLLKMNMDGSLDFFLLTTEEDKQGRIILFGKVKLQASKSNKPGGGGGATKQTSITDEPVTKVPLKYASCCIIIEKMERNVFFLPRDYKLDQDGESTTIQVTDTMIEAELKQLVDRSKIKDYKLKKVKRTSAFDYSVPHKNGPVGEQHYVWKLSYPSNQMVFPNDIKGSTFRCAYGITSSPVELFLIKRKIMGPTWLTVSGITLNFDQKKSFARYEATVKSFKSIKPSMYKNEPSPPLTVMSISTKSVMKGSSHEVVMISSVIHESISADGPTENQDSIKYITAIRPLTGQVFPPDFQKPGASTTKQNVTICTSERNLLSFFCETVLNADPDVFAGHNIIGYDIEVILDRLEKLKVMEWAFIGRLKRSSFDRFNHISGRLICDSYLVCKEFLPKEKNYSLVELSKNQLSINKPEINYLSIEPYFETTKKLNIFIEINENDCYIIFLLIFKLLVFPLTKQLTNLAGNQWDKSLKSNRAERIEYLLLHNFHEKKYLLPDKIYQKSSSSGGGGGAKDKDNHAAYSGGLVLDPKIDFYDRYVVLLDFNSLYPSIIQEYNVCFTTINRVKRDDGKWEEAMPPPSSIEKGILPKVLHGLVSKRREIKKRMEQEKNKIIKAQYDIQQQAVKLIANSMYGCLGFSHSRFYALPLAELVTRKGRENLQKGASIVNKMCYDVIYGDTDSLMIYTGVGTFNEAETIGKEIQKKINDQYRGSVMEIGLDGIFKRLLLFKKKKYACLKEFRIDSTTTKCERENKGIDIVRRDYCDLTKDIGQWVLNLILGGEEKIALFSLIKEYLESVQQQIKDNTLAVEKFIITKTLSKQPEEYNDADIQPHVQVALQMRAKGLHVQPGEQVPYIITHGNSSSDIKEEWHHRARAPSDVESIQDVDIDWYLSQQILPSIQRNTGPIGMEPHELAQWLGMTGTKYQKQFDHLQQQSNQDFKPRYTLSTEDLRYKQCKSFNFECPYCGQNNEFTGIVKIDSEGKSESGFDCNQCHAKIPLKKLANQLQLNIRTYLKQYNDWDLRCTECEKVSKNYKETSYRCARPQCRGKMIQIMTSSKLFNQISFFSKLFRNDLSNSDNTTTIIPNEDQNTLKQAKQIIDSFLSKFDQYNVNLNSLLTPSQTLDSFNNYLASSRASIQYPILNK
ncbi:DNA polymerase alpha catalytic subunit [Dictyostelium discoideum AX4]|uniref:DNA polymerase alpha catalytic subunit n=1 Tax=Dictyostelium discoideum TaxID=44689 RepID=DPOLA_DICDI|nr:DNA polymerase alpha catalytic subunit [Dictyostelium discoideum AX4]Q54SV8.1 RecName: Full=DNA polymerase alpha catalytic subunit [Dictyostelium discoideum]EAL66301.1 DNA polymerase alpha catalytic subunit [Dictyostelium discoideum AX4]|eukprot:XP_640277.1 DNA polymerase alpha catalytic subunit [Dictyostelium discoideum AX4]